MSKHSMRAYNICNIAKAKEKQNVRRENSKRKLKKKNITRTLRTTAQQQDDKN